MKKKFLLPGMSMALAGLMATAMPVADTTQSTLSDNTFEIKGFNPEAGSTVKQLGTVTMLVGSNYGEFMVMVDSEKAATITLTGEDGKTIAATELGEFGFDEETFDFMIPVSFPAITEAGAYTLTVPEGVLVEAAYDSEWNMIPADNGKVNAATTAVFVVDPAMKGKLENYTFVPASGSNVGSLSEVKLLFPELPAIGGFQQSEDGVEITVTNGEETYAGHAVQDWSGEESCKAMNFYFENSANPDEDVVFTSGKWTLTIPEGAFAYEGELSPAMEAEFSVVAPSETPFSTWNSFPAADSDVRILNNVRLMYIVSEDVTLNADSELFSEIRLLKDGKDTYAEFEMGEPSMIMNDMVMMIPLVFDSQTAAGEYELQLPRGLFYQTRFDETTGAFDVFDGYQQSSKESIYYNVDPSNEGLLEDVTLLPEAGSVQSLENVTLTFNLVPSYIAVNQLGFDDITLVQGGTQYVGVASLVEKSGNCEYAITFVDATGDVVTPGTGEWTLTIPDGYFMLDGSKSTEMVASYNVCPVVLTPASGATLTEITYFEVSFPEAKTAEFVGSEYMITLVAGQASGIPAFNVSKVEDAECPTFRLTPPAEYAEPSLGNLTFSIEEGAFLIDGEAGQTEGNSPRVSASYVYDRPVSQEYVPEPNSDEVLCHSWGYTVGFAFDSSTRPSVSNYSTFEGIEVMFDDTLLRIGSENDCYSGKADCAYAIMDNVLSFMVVNQDFHKEGRITVRMSGDAYKLSGRPGFDIEHTWNVVMPKEYTVEIKPAGGDSEANAQVVDSLKEITLVFENAESVEVFQPSGVALKKSDYSIFMTAEIIPVEDAGCPACRLVFTAPDGKEMTDGIYELEIRYDTFTLDGVQTWPSNYTNIVRVFKLDTLSGVEGIGSGNSGTVTVVTTDGKVILKDAPAESVSTVGKGIYIVNGKKTVIGGK